VAVIVFLNLTIGFPATRVAFGGASPIVAIGIMFICTLIGIAGHYFYYMKVKFNWRTFLKPMVISPIILLPLIGSVKGPSELEPIQMISFAILAFQNGFFGRRYLKMQGANYKQGLRAACPLFLIFCLFVNTVSAQSSPPKGVLPAWQPERATSFGITADEALIKGKEYFSARRYKMALPFIQKSAESGSNMAMLYLGVMYADGLGVTKNYAEAVRWYRKSSDTGNIWAMNNLGWMYHNGWGVTQDYANAKYWYRKGADAGDPLAMTNLAWLYRDGLGVIQDYVSAEYWYARGAIEGQSTAMHNLGTFYRDGKGGLTQDYSKALHWYRKSAAAGNDWGFTQLGVMYENGLGVTKNYAEAVRWYRKAADAGNESSIKRLKDLGEQP